HVLAVVLEGEPLNAWVDHIVQHPCPTAHALGHVQVAGLVAVEDKFTAVDLSAAKIEAGILAELGTHFVPRVSGQQPGSTLLDGGAFPRQICALARQRCRIGLGANVSVATSAIAICVRSFRAERNLWRVEGTGYPRSVPQIAAKCQGSQEFVPALPSHRQADARTRSVVKTEVDPGILRQAANPDLIIVIVTVIFDLDHQWI